MLAFLRLQKFHIYGRLLIQSLSKKEGLFLDLEQKLQNHHLNCYPFHMPGHKRNVEVMGNTFPYHMDITEIEGFDDLHHANGILKECMEDAAKLWGAKSTFFLINGSTSGILSGIRALTKTGDTVLMARGCHRSVYHAIELCHLHPVYLVPPICQNLPIFGSISPQMVKKALQEHPDCKLVILTSPTYEGIVSDIASIAQIVHDAGAYLLVDEAHGAHFGFDAAFPMSAIRLGADIVIQSIHKTLPAPTQTALLHVCSARVPLAEVRRQLAIFQTSSPSYVLLSQMQRCVTLLQTNGAAYFTDYAARLQHFYHAVSHLSKLRVRPLKEDVIFDADIGKILIDTSHSNINGTTCADILRHQYGIETELSQPSYVLAMTSILDTEKGFLSLIKALCEIDQTLQYCTTNTALPLPPPPHAICSITQALEQPQETLSFSDAVHRTAADYVWAYPPGIPLIVPGEEFRAELLHYIQTLQNNGISVWSAYSHTAQIQVVRIFSAYSKPTS